MQTFKVLRADGHEPITISGRCPHCRREVTFDAVGSDKWFNSHGNVSPGYAGVKVCANPSCRGLVLFVQQDAVTQLFPPEPLDFDVTGIPARVASLVEEAVACHAVACYRASAIMIRRALEEICADLGATGKDLMTRIESMKAKVVLPQGMIDAMHVLRVFGNDAAHLEAKAYDEIGKEEVELAIAIAKEIVKGAYQLSHLLDRMRALKKQ